MTKRKHPSNRYERMLLEKKYEERPQTKRNSSQERTGRVRKFKPKEFEAAKEETYGKSKAGVEDFPV